MAVERNAQPVKTGPIQAPTPAISLTSPAPMPPMAYSGIRRRQPDGGPGERPAQQRRPRRSSMRTPSRPAAKCKRQPVGDPQRAAVDHRRLDEHERHQVRDLTRDLGHGRLLPARWTAGPIPGLTATPGRPGITRASTRNVCRIPDAVKSGGRRYSRTEASIDRRIDIDRYTKDTNKNRKIEPPVGRSVGPFRVYRVSDRTGVGWRAVGSSPRGRSGREGESVVRGSDGEVARDGRGHRPGTRPGRPPRGPSGGHAGLSRGAPPPAAARRRESAAAAARHAHAAASRIRSRRPCSGPS